jgi:hypothetical protein
LFEEAEDYDFENIGFFLFHVMRLSSKNLFSEEIGVYG